MRLLGPWMLAENQLAGFLQRVSFCLAVNCMTLCCVAPMANTETYIRICYLHVTTSGDLHQVTAVKLSIATEAPRRRAASKLAAIRRSAAVTRRSNYIRWYLHDDSHKNGQFITYVAETFIFYT